MVNENPLPNILSKIFPENTKNENNLIDFLESTGYNLLLRSSGDYVFIKQSER